MAEVKATIVADASGVGPGAAEASKQINSIQATVAGLSKSFAELAGAAKASMAAVATSTKEAAVQVKEAAESVKAFREAFTGVGEAMVAAFAVEAVTSFVERMAETAEQVKHTAVTFGLTTSEVQRLKAEAAGAGVPFEALIRSMGLLDKSFASAKAGATRQAEAYKLIGISTNEALTQTELLQRAIQGFAGMEDGPAKVAAAYAVFGRNIQAIGPIIGLTKEELEGIDQATKDFGIENDDAASKGIALAESMNTNKIAMQGIGNVVTQTLAPVLKQVVDVINDLARSFVKSYREGGTAKGVMDALAVSVKVIVGLIELAVFQFQELFNASGYALAQLINIGTYLLGNGKIAVDEMIGAFKTLGQVIVLAFTGKASQIKGVMDGYQASVRIGNQQMADNARALGARMASQNKQTADSMLKDWNTYFAHTKQLFTDAGANAPLPKGGAGTTGDDPGTPKGAGAPSQMEKWKEQFAEEQDAHAGMLHNEEADELAFWQRIIASGTANAKQLLEIKKRVAELTRSLNKQAINDEIADARQATADKIAEINTDLANDKRAIAEDERASQDAYRRGEISRRQLYDRMVTLANEQAAKEQAAAAAVRDLRVALDEEIKSRNASNTEAYKRAVDDQAKAYQEFADKVKVSNAELNVALKKADQSAADEFKAKWDAAVSPMVHSFTSGLLEMARGTRSFAQVMTQMGVQMVNDFVAKVVDPMVERWLWGEAGKTVATVAGTRTRTTAEAAGHAQGLAIHAAASIAHIAMDAARAFAGAYAAIADISYVGPFLAPAVAAGALAAVLAAGHSIASAEGGWGSVPYDGATTVLHKREMVLPAAIADPLRNSLAEGGIGGGNQFHFHMGPGSDGAGLQNWFDQHGDKLMKTVNGKLRRQAALGE